MRASLTMISAAAAIVAVGSRSLLPLSSAEETTASCDLESLAPLLVDPRNDECLAYTGIAFPPPRGTPPTDDQWASACAVPACGSLLSDLELITPSECAIGQYSAHADLVNKYKLACGIPLDGGPQTRDSVASSSSSSMDGSAAEPETISIADLTPAPTPSPSTTNTVVEALTNSAPRLSTSTASLSILVTLAATLLGAVASFL